MTEILGVMNLMSRSFSVTVSCFGLADSTFLGFYALESNDNYGLIK